MSRRALSHPELPDPPHFSRAVETTGGRTVWFAGQAPIDARGVVVDADDMAGQADRCLSKIEAILVEAGGSMADVVSLTFFVTDIGRLREIQPVRDKFLTGPVLPALSGVEVAALAHPDWLIEIDGVAVIDD